MPRTPEASPTRGVDLTYTDRTEGVTFLYPPGWEILAASPDDPPGVTLHGPPLGEGPEPIIFAITVEVETVGESSVKEIIDQQLDQVPADLRSGIVRRDLSVGGEPGEQVIGLPSRAGAIETCVVRRGKLYLVILQPYDEGNESLLPYLSSVREVYGGLLSSWKWTN